MVDETLEWIARERDACWTARLVILRVWQPNDIQPFGCPQEHDAHIEELRRLARTNGVSADPDVLADAKRRLERLQHRRGEAEFIREDAA